MLKQKLQLKQSLSLSPQQIRLMKLIELPADAFSEQVAREVEENPMLEPEEEQSFEELTENILKESSLNYKGGSLSPSYETEQTYLVSKSLTEMLEEQIANFIVEDENLHSLIHIMIGYIGDSGYLERDIPDILDDLAFSQNLIVKEADLQKALSFVQQLEPAGVGARNLKECLLLQLEQKSVTEVRQKAKSVLSSHFEALTKKHYDKILADLSLSKETLKQVIDEIERLNPKPGFSYEEASNSSYVLPDFEIFIVNNKIKVGLTRKNTPNIKVNKNYLKDLDLDGQSSKQPHQKEALNMIKKNIDDANWYVDAINQRKQTLLSTAKAIVKYQEAYFLSGIEKDLKPMILKDISAETGLNISTISRVINSKYAATPYGLKKLKAFFSEGYETKQGEEKISSIEIKSTLKELTDQESKQNPLTDDKLVEALTRKGYPIARRTVAKYRKQLNIPPARLRKEL